MEPLRLPQLLDDIIRKHDSSPSPQLVHVLRLAVHFLPQKAGENDQLSSTTLFFALVEYGVSDEFADQAAYVFARLTLEHGRQNYEEMRSAFFKEGYGLSVIGRHESVEYEEYSLTPNVEAIIELANQFARERNIVAPLDTIDLIRALLLQPATGLENRLKQTKDIPSPTELWENLVAAVGKWPAMEFGNAVPPNADILFASTDFQGNMGSLSRYVATELGLDDNVTTKRADELSERGFTWIEVDDDRLLGLVVTVGGQGNDPQDSLSNNLGHALDSLGESLKGRSLWIPFMGTGDAEIKPRDSLAASIRGLRLTGCIERNPPSRIIISSNTQFAEIQDDLEKDFYWAFPSATRTQIGLESNFRPDQPSSEDHLGQSLIVDALAAFLRDPKTKSPLAIAIDAPWGTGKSSIMMMLRDELQANAEEADRIFTRRRSLPLSWGHVWSGTDAEDFRPRWRHIFWPGVDESDPAEELRKELAKEKDGRVFETIYFNAWRHGTGERLTSRLVNRIIQNLVDRRGTEFWLDLNKNRFDRWALRRSVLTALLSRIPVIALILLLLVFSFFLMTNWTEIESWSSIQSEDIQKFLAKLGVGAGWIGCLVLLCRTFMGLLKAPVTIDAERYVRVPDYHALGGAQVEIERDFQMLLKTLREEDEKEKKETVLVVFIDDLDRCSPGTAVEVVETINVFFGQEVQNCIFILGMHRELVAASLELAHEKLVQKIKEKPELKEERWFGRRFLEKIVQFVVHIPEPNDDQIRDYVDHLTGRERGVRAERAVRMRVRRFLDSKSEDRTPEASEITRRESTALGIDSTDSEAVEAVQRVVEAEVRFSKARNLDEKNKDAHAVFHAVQHALRKNPRQYVRFFNTLRFDNYLDSLTPSTVPPRDLLLLLAKRTVLFLEWPDIWSVGVREEEAFTKLLQLGSGGLGKFLQDHYKGIGESEEVECRYQELREEVQLKALLDTTLLS